MGITLDKEVAQKLIVDIQASNTRIAAAGDILIKLKGISGWNDKQHDTYEIIINACLKLIGTTINNQEDYKNDFQKAIKKLEG